MKYTKDEIKEAFKNRRRKVKKLEKALQAIQPKEVSREKELTIKRHIKGLIDVVKELDCDVHSGYTPKCRKCYEEHGWISKCICKI